MSKIYKNQLYNNYASNIQNSPEIYKNEKIDRWGRKYNYYLRGWLPIQKDSAIAELACGSGRLLYQLKKWEYTNLSAVDFSPEQVKLAKQVLPNVDEDDVINWLKKHPSAFDCLIGIDLIEHIDKEETLHFLDACFAALKPQGVLILQTPNAESPMGLGIRYGDFTHELGFSPKSLTDLLTVVGFHDDESREVGPIPFGYGFKSTIRSVIWQLIRLFLLIWNIAETGTAGSKIFSRVFLIKANK